MAGDEAAGETDNADEDRGEEGGGEERRPDLDGLAVIGSGEQAGAETGDQPAGKCFETELPALSVIPLSVFLEKPAKSAEEKVEEDGAPAELA